MHKLGWTDFSNRYTEGWLGKLGGNDSLTLVGPKCYEKETGSLQCRLGGTDLLILVRLKCYKKETGSLQSHLGETEIPISETEVTRVCGSGYVI